MDWSSPTVGHRTTPPSPIPFPSSAVMSLIPTANTWRRSLSPEHATTSGRGMSFASLGLSCTAAFAVLSTCCSERMILPSLPRVGPWTVWIWWFISRSIMHLLKVRRTLFFRSTLFAQTRTARFKRPLTKMDLLKVLSVGSQQVWFLPVSSVFIDHCFGIYGILFRVSRIRFDSN